MGPFAENLSNLHAEEESVRSIGWNQIANDPGLILQLESVEASMNVLIHFSIRWPTDELDLLTIQHLGIRLFNSTAAGLKLLLAGYYQGAAAQFRDLLETGFLLDYLGTDSQLIATWRDATTSKQRGQFQPINIRRALDKRDGFVEGQRDEHYRVLSNYATHPNPKGFLLLRATGSSLAGLSPFYDLGLLRALLHEVSMDSLLAANTYLDHFETRSPTDSATRAAFLEVRERWRSSPTSKAAPASMQ